MRKLFAAAALLIATTAAYADPPGGEYDITDFTINGQEAVIEMSHESSFFVIKIKFNGDTPNVSVGGASSDIPSALMENYVEQFENALADSALNLNSLTDIQSAANARIAEQ